ncbi:MAG: UvrD-helicase domain-containing protein [Chitinispirillales bacterium]|jgi:exodeoxyribonuclease V beta subunit|nr:UvrD-helicase domain-containing protein [Chitinispirillales bacterium]
MSNSRNISTVNDIDLSLHGIIEAHAGTGKTYTIVKLVLAMLEQTNDKANDFTHLRKILLVTYTEKAAGELKKRIQDGISQRIKELPAGEPDLKNHLENCLNNMHEALIGTIHSVCLRLLQTWPFETGVHFSTQIADNEDCVERLLRESMRTDWQDETAHIPQALKALESHGIKLELDHFGLICKIALELMNNNETTVDIQSDVSGSIKELIESLENARSKVNDAESSLVALLKNYHKLLTDLHASGKLEAKRQEIISKLISRIFTMTATGSFDTAILSNPKKCGGNTMIYTDKERKSIYEYASVIDDAAEEISNHRYISALEKLKKLHTQLLFTLISESAKILAARCSSYKQQNGFISYSDMLGLIYKALYVKDSAILKTLKEQLRYGIIDEFQDTSVLQWKIFRKIFLDDRDQKRANTRIFIVGDPKQSIYSFQNADIQSYIAAKKTIAMAGGALYRLTLNYRSLPEVIRGYNAILKPERTPERGGGEDWFLFGKDNDEDNIAYPASESAQPPARAVSPQYPLSQKAIQIISLTEDEKNGGKTLAAKMYAAIKKLKGTKISIPKGEDWEDLTLDYKDFAVIVETHALAANFIEEFRTHGIPYEKYKQKGVFSSSLARDLRAVLVSLLNRDSQASHTSAMLTHFFNVPPAAIDPQHCITPCSNVKCSGNNLCVAHALEHWGYLADKRLWAQLFKNILERTEIQQKLIRLTDGERRLSDLRQVTDYCIERLYQNNAGLEELVNHLERLYKNEERAAGDKNIYTLSTEKSSVKILTMHASKGLEFPVVFVVSGDSRSIPKSPDILLWTDINKKRKLTPYLSNPKKNQELTEAVQNYLHEQRQERRRLLYVAVTRAQAMLFACLRDDDNDLSPHLKELLNQQNPDTALFDELQSSSTDDTSTELKTTETIFAIPKEIPELNLKPFIIRQTSYSQLSRNLSGNRDVDRSEEYYAFGITAENKSEAPLSLPGGRLTGDALHRAIEELLGRQDLRKTLMDKKAVENITGKYLKRNGVLDYASTKENAAAVSQASQYIKNALTSPLTLPGSAGAVIIADLPESDLVPEMEFLLSFAPHWIRGFMDLVFRIRNDKHPAHPYRYYIVDWKSDCLKNFTQDAINRYCIDNHYDFQAKVYSHALNKYLKSILGTRYNPVENIGGSLHLFLRGFDSACGSGVNENTWVRSANPAADEDELRSRFLSWING